MGLPGEDLQAGESVFTAGRCLRPQDVGVLSSMGISQLPVVKKVRVRILVTGDELLSPGSTPHGCFIADANSPMLSAFSAPRWWYSRKPGHCAR